MRFHRNRSHVIDLIFPLAVLFVFAASSLVVLILSVHIYTGQTEQAEAHYRTDTPLSYVEEKIRQNDVAGSISVMTLDGTECLALKNSSDGINSTTYLYVSDGWLKELFVRNDTDVSLNAGKNIIEASDFKAVIKLSDFEIRSFDNILARITITDTDGVTNSRILSERSHS